MLGAIKSYYHCIAEMQTEYQVRSTADRVLRLESHDSYNVREMKSNKEDENS